MIAPPILDHLQLRRLAAAEQVATVRIGVFQTRRAKIISPPFEQLGMKIAHHFFDDGNVLVNELFLEVDRMGANDRLATLLQRVFNRRHKICQRLADARGGLNHQRVVFLQSLTHQLRHALLLRPVFKLRRGGQSPLCGKGVMHALRQRRPASGTVESIQHLNHERSRCGDGRTVQWRSDDSLPAAIFFCQCRA
jgi:hypothetical protein